MLARTWKNTNSFQRALFLFALVLIGRLLFLFNVGLIDDDAYHWSWIKELQLSYYDHPAMIAWLEWLSTAVFGDTYLGVRLPSFLCYVAIVIVAWRLAWELFDEFAAHATAFLILFTPLWGIGGHVSSPEPPFILCWLLAAWVFWQGVREDDRRWSPRKTWLWLGVIMGLGLESKFIMAMLAPGFGLYLLFTSSRRRDLLTLWPWVGVLVATLLCLPIFLWNHEAGWPGFMYQFHDRHQDGGGQDFGRWLTWFGTQWAFMSPVPFALMLIALPRAFALRAKAEWRFILCLALPSIAVFAVQPYFADYKPHWAGASYLFLAMGAGALWSQGLEIGERRLWKPRSRWLTGGTLLVLIPINLIVYSSFLHPWMPKVFRVLNPGQEWNTQMDLSNEFFGWEDFGDFINLRQREIHATTGRRPFIAALRYETTAQTWWGTKQKTYHMSFTRSHYTVMQKLRGEMELLQGRDALVVTTEKYPANPIEWGRFDSCTPETREFFRSGELARTFTLWWCRNFQGILK